MAKYVVDTNVFIDVLRSAAERQAYERFLHHGLALTYVSAVVGMEILAGARSGAHALALESELLGPFQRRGRLFEPSATALLTVGRLLSGLTAQGKPLVSRSFVNDLLIGVSCRERGVTVLTRDADFQRVCRLVPGLRVEAPYPELRRPKTGA